MNYISLRFISTTAPPFMIVFNPRLIFVQNRPPLTPPHPPHPPAVWHLTEIMQGRGMFPLHGDVPALLCLSLIISLIGLLANYWLLPVNVASEWREAGEPASQLKGEAAGKKRKGTWLLKERQINICSFTCLPLPHTHTITLLILINN